MTIDAKLYVTALLVPVACVLLIGLSNQGWHLALLLLPAAFLFYGVQRLRFARKEDERTHADSMANLHLRTVEALRLAIEAQDKTTHDHLRRVQVYAVEIGRELQLDEMDLAALGAAAVLHDIGKLAVPEYITSKPGKLSAEEFEKMKIHPVVGAEILERVQFPYPVAPIVRAHHEKWNGTGYPLGLCGEDIPMGARILSAVDAFDAMASDRQYRRALPLDQAMEAIEQDSGKAFDPVVVIALKRCYTALEKKARMAGSGCSPLSLDLKIARGAAPAAGFEGSAASMRLTGGVQSPISLGDVLEPAYATGPLSRDELFPAVAAQMKRLAPHDAFALYLIGNDELIPEYVTGHNHRLFSSLRIPVGQGLSGWVARNRKPILNGNASVEAGYLNNPPIFSTMRSAISTPLYGAAGLLGVLSLYHEADDAFTMDQLRLLQSIAPRLGLAIEALLPQPVSGFGIDLPDPTCKCATFIPGWERYSSIGSPSGAQAEASPQEAPLTSVSSTNLSTSAA